jgi:sugar lactone lactonase YvrE
MQIRQACETTFGWGESVVWDERRERLYFVDCASWKLHWLDGGEGELHGRRLPSMPTGVVPMEDGRLLIVLDGGLCAVDPEKGDEELVTAFPSELDGRANDACADLAGNVITGKLNLGPAPGRAWRWSAADGWLLLDADIANTNGPAVAALPC